MRNVEGGGGEYGKCSVLSIEVIDVLLSLKLAAILKTCISVTAPLPLIEQATSKRIGEVRLTFSLVPTFK
jgi:hypothetical protein